MLHLTSQTKIFIAISPVDFRKQIDGLVALCTNSFNRQPRDGSLYVFINRSRTMIKILGYNCGGYWLCLKRLSCGKYSKWPKSDAQLSPVVAHELQDILKNMVASKLKLV